MSRNPLVSGITIFLNAERFIEEAIKSVLTQTYDYWELLLVDDGSTDSSTEIAQRYAQQYPKIRYLEHDNHQNRGMSASRNLGIHNAKGEYIAFLDADDVWLPRKLEQQVALLNSQPEAVMLYGRTQYWFSWTRQPADSQRDCMTKLRVQPNTLVRPPTLLTLYLQDEQIYPCTCSILVRRKAFEEIGGFEEDFRTANEDMVFHSKVFLQAPVFVASECWDRYRIHPDSYWSNYWADKQNKGHFPHLNQPHPERRNYLNWLAGYLAREKIKEPVVWQALQIALWPYRHPMLYGLSAPLRHLIWRMKLIGQRILPVSLRCWLDHQLLLG